MTVVFDMDGTLFAGDSQLRFVIRILRRRKWRFVYALLAVPVLLSALVGVVSSEFGKRFFFCILRGYSAEELAEECRDFVQSDLLPAVYPELAERVRAHRRAGDELILCTASPVWWARLVGEYLGFSRTIATPMRLRHGRVPLLPSIDAPGNNRGAVKVQRLRAAGVTHAAVGYTDSAADLPMLALCDRAVLVNPSRSLMRRVPGAEVLRPAR